MGGPKRRSLRTRLFAIVLLGIVLLTLVNVLANGWGLSQVRDQAINDSTLALQQQAESYLQRLAQDRAGATAQTLAAIQQLVTATGSMVARTTALPPPPTPPIIWQPLADGRRYRHGRDSTMLLMARADEALLREDLAAQAQLGSLLPDQRAVLPGVLRLSYLARGGLMYSAPRLDMPNIPLDWQVEEDPAFRASLPETNPQRQPVWTASHRLVDGDEQVISAVAPVYQDGRFKGAVVADVSLEQLTRFLTDLAVAPGFAFLADSRGQLIAVPEAGQRPLLGARVARYELGRIALDQVSPSLGPVLATMRSGQSGVAAIDLRGRTYLLAYAPIAGIDWHLIMATPLDEITASTEATSARIISIAHDTQRIGLLASVVAVVLLGVVMSYLLRRQFTQPLVALMQATKAVADGDLRPIALARQDEMGQLAASFNTMTVALEASRAEILAANQRLEQTVQERTRELREALRAAEQARRAADEANRLKSQFLANMSHELRTPLNAIINFTHFLGDEDYGTLNEQQRFFQSRVIYNAEHLLGLINDILDLSKIEAGKMELRFEEVDLRPLLQGVMATAVGLTRDKGLTLTLDTPEELPLVWVDRTRIRQVLLNLLSNAAKFTLEGGITVRVRPEGEGYLAIAVEDTGIGISAEDQAAIFEEFRQVNLGLEPAERGAGLGLPISKRLVELHGGRLRLESTPGRGSTFTFTIPIAAATPEHGPAATAPRPSAAPTSPKR